MAGLPSDHHPDEGMQPTEIDAVMPPPFLMNGWKHHAGILRGRIASAVSGGEAGVATLPERIVSIGTELMDLYLGALSPGEVAAAVTAQLRAAGSFENAPFQAWIEGGGGYRSITLSADGSVWVLRHGVVADRWIHIHPGRWTPHTRRVRANVLKTVVCVLAEAELAGANPLELELVNRVRVDRLGLSPMKTIAPDEGLGQVIRELQAVTLVPADPPDDA